jgi:DNA-binding transcriptional regulator YdaS (Cro superfamily)
VTDLLTADDVRARLRKACEEAGGQAAWARARGVSRQYIGQVLLGARAPSEAILKALGMSVVTRVTYKRIKNSYRLDSGADHV